MAAASSLPTDPLLEIFLHLEPTDVIRCACVCKPWRRDIIGNAASLRRHRADRFDPSLLLGLGVFHFGEHEARLWRMPGPFQSALPFPSNGVGRYETARSLIPDASAAAAATAVADGAGFVFDTVLYRDLLWSADGFILLMARTVKRLCLFNPVTGDCAFLPTATAAPKCSAYALLTGYDAAATGTGDKLAVQKSDRFTFSKGKEGEGGLSYQVLLTSGAGAGAGVWGPVQRSSDESEQGLCVYMDRRSTLVRRDTVYWLAGPAGEGSITCTLALDLRTGRTWTTELPRRHRRTAYRTYPDSYRPVLATSGDGRLSLVEPLRGTWIHVWVMLSDGDGDGDAAWWTVQQTIAMDAFPDLCSLSAFCPRSGCVVGVCFGRYLLIDIHSGSRTRVVCCVDDDHRGYDYHQYEMDCSSTYISKMKHF